MDSKLYPTHELHERGQRIWVDDITRDMLNDGTLQRYRDEFSVTGLTSNPTIFQEAIGKGNAYDEQIQTLTRAGMGSEALFAALAIADLQRAADLFRPIYDHTGGLDGWVSMEVSPLLIHDATATALAAQEIHKAAQRPNLFVKIPGTPEAVGAIEETIFSGVPVNVTLLFSAQQYQVVAEAYMRALERRQAAGLDLKIPSVASIFVSRWDKAVAAKVPEPLRNKLGIAIAQQVLLAYRQVITSERWCSLEVAGARAQRLLWASTGTKDPKAPADLYVSALAVPDTIDTMPPKTLLAFAKEGTLAPDPLSSDPSSILKEFAAAGVDTEALAAQLQNEGGDSFAKSWRSLMESLESKRQALLRQPAVPSER
jgi:transaldolase